jgi:hypothetical protein
MPTIEGIDWFTKDTFTVPPYITVTGTPTRDTSVVHEADLASMKLVTAANAQGLIYPDISSGHTLLWNACWYRLDSLASGDIDLMRAEGTAGGVAVIAYASASGLIYHYIVGGSTFPTRAYTFASWIWVEHIFDVTSSPLGAYTRIDDTDLTSVTLAGTPTTGRRVKLGPQGASAAASTSYYSTHLWGYASSTSDWLGKANAMVFHPGKGVVVADTLAATSVSQSFVNPWELTGASQTVVLGDLLNTQSIVRVITTVLRSPGISDDVTAGYTIGDMWIWGGRVWWCTSTAAGAAVWKESA